MTLGIWVVFWVWFLVSNAFFGWNWTPQSAEELICDGIALILGALALVSWGRGP